MAEQGWIKLHRCIRSNWVWNDKPYSRGQAFMDLVLSVNHEDKKIIFNGALTEIKRGSFITSIRKLGDKWGWSNKKVKKFLDQLQLDQTIAYESNTKRTLISIENYDLYQSKETPKKQQSTTEETLKHNKSISEAYQKHTNKNDKELLKNDKEGKEKKEGSNSPLSFPSLVHEEIANNISEVAYKTWFKDAEITSGENDIKIKTTEFNKGVIKDRYKDQLEVALGKNINLEVNNA